MKNYKGILFDDYTINEDKTEWSQICNECYIAHKEITERELDENSGHGICGVLKCDNDSDHYIDFATR